MNSAYTIHKASFFKRVAALIVDLFLVFVLFILVENFVMHPILNATSNYDALDTQYEQKLVEYNIGHYEEVTKGDKKYTKFTYNELKEGEKDYDWTEFRKDEEAVKIESKLNTLGLFSTTMDFMISEFLVLCLMPLILKNGQTLGKKLMKLALVSTNEVKVQGWNVFARWAIGIYAFETMINLFFFSFFIIPVPLLISCLMTVISKKGMALHDYIGGTIVVDLNNTVILDSVEERRARILEEKEAYESAQKFKKISQKEIEKEGM